MVFIARSASESIGIVSFGARTAIGLVAESSAASARAGVAAFTTHPYLIDPKGKPMVTAMVPYLPADLSGCDRLAELALPSAREAVAPIADALRASRPVHVILGLPADRPGLPEGVGTALSRRLIDSGLDELRHARFDVFSHGNAAGLMALEEGCQRLLRGETDICLVGGCDSYLDPVTLEWLYAEELLKSDAHRWGFVPGEAAAFCILTSAKVIDQHGLPVAGRVVSAATEREEDLTTAGAICVGRALTQAIKRVLDVLPVDQKVDDVICDLNGQRSRADEYGFSMARLSRRFAKPSSFRAPADSWGNVGAASGLLFVILAVLAGRNGYARGPRTLVWAASDHSERSAALLDVPVQPREH